MRQIFLDRVLITFLSILACLFIFVSHDFNTLLESWSVSLLAILPYILLSSILAAALKASRMELIISKYLKKRSLIAIPIASSLAVIAPLCACSVIPVITALLRSGAPLAPVMAFWVAAPIMDPEMFILMWPVLGLPLTIGKLIAAILTGMFAGFVAYSLSSRLSFQSPLKAGLTTPSCCNDDLCTEHSQVNYLFWKDRKQLNVFLKTSTETIWFLLRWLALAFLIEAIIVAYLDHNHVSQWLSHENGVIAYPLAALSGLPLYINGYAAIPLVNGMMDLGMSPGVALTFMIAGGASCIPAAIALWGVVNKYVFFAYLSVALVMAVVLGVIYQSLPLA